MTLKPIALVYSKPECPYCVKAVALLNAMDMRQVKYTVDVDFTREQLMQAIPADRRPEKLTFPQIFINGEYIGGYEALVRHVEGK